MLEIPALGQDGADRIALEFKAWATAPRTFFLNQTQTKLKQKFRTQSGEVTLKEQWQEKTLEQWKPTTAKRQEAS